MKKLGARRWGVKRHLTYDETQALTRTLILLGKTLSFETLSFD